MVISKRVIMLLLSCYYVKMLFILTKMMTFSSSISFFTTILNIHCKHNFAATQLGIFYRVTKIYVLLTEKKLY